MRLNRLPLIAPLALVATLAATAPALAGGVVSIDDDTLAYSGDERRAEQRHDLARERW